MSPLPGQQLVGVAVHVDEADVGVVEDLVLGADLSVVLGLVVELRRSERRAFLPWVAVSVAADAVAVPSPTTILGEIELEHYLESGVRLSRLAGLPLAGDSLEPSVVSDALVELPDGRATGLVLADSHGTRRVDLGQTRIRWTEGRLLELSITRDASDGPELAAREPALRRPVPA